MIAVSAGSANARSPWLLFAKTQYLQPDDFIWLAERQATVVHRAEEWALEAYLMLRFANFNVPSTLDVVLNAAQYNPVLTERANDICAAVPLNSEEARQARRYHAEMQDAEGHMKRQAKREKRIPKRPVRVERWLKETEEQPGTHWRLLEEMARTPDNDYANSMNLDVQSFPG